MPMNFGPEDRTLLVNALSDVPQFELVRERRALIRTALDGHPFSPDIHRTLRFLDWDGPSLTVADTLVRLIEGQEVAPGFPALRALVEAIGPLTGAHREDITKLQQRLGWVAKPAHTPPPAMSPDLAERRARGEYDIFLCLNSKDKPAILEIANSLLARDYLPWIDVWDLQPGFSWHRAIEAQIDSIKSAAVFIGPSAIGPWQDEEADAILRRFKTSNRPVIPAFLEGAPDIELPAFLDGRHRVDFRRKDPDPIDQLIFGITGQNPRFAVKA
jgi:TIR domain/Effector-associated domain 8